MSCLSLTHLGQRDATLHILYSEHGERLENSYSGRLENWYLARLVLPRDTLLYVCQDIKILMEDVVLILSFIAQMIQTICKLFFVCLYLCFIRTSNIM